MPRSRTSTVLVLAGLTLGLTACERGCLVRWFADQSSAPGVGGPAPRGSGSPQGPPAVDLGGTDCSDGLARCVDGRVEASLAAHLPYPCNPTGTTPERPGSCECPWELAGSCAGGCVKEGIEVVASAEVARVQLCKAGGPVLRPPLPTELANAPFCAEDGVSCVDGIVRACMGRGQPSQVVAACSYGCGAAIGVQPGDVLTGDGPAAILCRRADAERR